MIDWLALSTFLALVQTNECKPELRIGLVDAAGVGDEILSSVRREVERLYRPAGVAIVWAETSVKTTGPHTATVYLMDEMPPSLVSRKRAFGGRAMALAFGRVVAHELGHLHSASAYPPGAHEGRLGKKRPRWRRRSPRS